MPPLYFIILKQVSGFSKQFLSCSAVLFFDYIKMIRLYKFEFQNLRGRPVRYFGRPKNIKMEIYGLIKSCFNNFIYKYIQFCRFAQIIFALIIF